MVAFAKLRRLNGREMKALFILSIVAPVGLLATFRLTGILQGPITISETMTLEAFKWEFERPNQYVILLDELNTTYATNGLSVDMYILMVDYANNSQFHDDNDFLRMVIAINSTSTNPNIFVDSLYVIFKKDSQPSLVDLLSTSFKFENLSLVSFSSGWTSGEQHKAAYARLSSANHSDRVYFRATVEWSLLTLSSQTHQMEVAYELTYYNRASHKKIVQPFQLKIAGK